MFMDGHHSEYHEINAGAHRNSPKTLTAPALVSHLAFWITSSAARGTGGSVGRTLESTIDDFLLSFSRKVLTIDPQVKLLPNISGMLLLFNTIADPESFMARDTTKLSLTDRQRDIFRSSNRCITIKFSWCDLDIAVRCEVHTEHFSLTTFVELNKYSIESPFTSLTDLNRCINDTLYYLRSSDEQEPAMALSKHLFEDFWENWHERFTEPLFIHDLPEQHSNVFKGIFADFRGIIFSEGAVRFEDPRFFSRFLGPRWGEAAKKKFLPFLTGYEAERLRKYECAINYLLNGRAMMLSTLAPQLPDAPINQRIPVRYIVYAHNKSPSGQTIINRRQLGRLIGLLHNLGTARIAALKDVKALRVVGQRLSSIDKLLQSARESIAGNDELAMQAIQDAHDDFNGIISDFRKAAHYSVLYRIERARYYIEQFNRGKARLRIARLEGDQPYDQFIEHRLGSQYDFIDRLGVRYERTASSISMLDSNFITIKASRLDKEIRNIQSWGEFILFISLVPYYISHIAEILIKKYLLPDFTLGVWTVLGFVAFWRKWGREGLLGASTAFVIILAAMAVFNSTHFKCTDYFEFCLKDGHVAP